MSFVAQPAGPSAADLAAGLPPAALVCRSAVYRPALFPLFLLPAQFENNPPGPWKVRMNFEEGRRYLAYRDMFNNVTIGVGHNMGLPGDDRDRALFERATGANYGQTKQGRLTLVEMQVEMLLDHDLVITLTYARQLVPTFDQLPPPAQEVVVDMTFNLGPGGFRQFRHLRAALAQRDWRQAAWDLAHKNRQPDSAPSDYQNQVPNRAQRNVVLLLSLGTKQTT
jgi:GH24 family phage-related lysozyme (muramidase)